jgi:tetratricopeptide (TPR) repeat protein
MSEFNYEIIDQYLAGELSGENLADFEKQMQANPALANEVRLYKAMGDGIKKMTQQNQSKEDLHRNIEAFNKEYFRPQAAPVVRIKKIWWLGAAAAVAAIVLLVVRPFALEKFNNEKLFAHYSAKTDELSIIKRGGKDDTTVIKAAELYNSKQYKEALPLLEKLVTVYPDDKDLIVAKGVSLLKTGNAGAAITIFNEIITVETVYKNTALWYKGLSFLKMNQLAESRNILETLPATADMYKEAQELIKKINKQLK